MISFKRLLAFAAIVFTSHAACAQAGNKWVKHFNTGPGSNFSVHTVVTDASGNVIVSGEKIITPSDFDIVTIKYDSLGNELWSHLYSGQGNQYDSPVKALVDNNGNIYVGGYTYSSVGEAWLLMKISPSGTLIWSDTTTYPPQGSGGNVLNDMEFDNAGNIILAGSLQRDLSFPTQHAAMAVAKIDPNGVELWRNVTPVDYADNKIRKIAIDQNDNIYAVGFEFHGSPPGDRFVVRKYSPSGSIMWQDIFDFDSTHNEMESGFDIAIDAAGDIYAAGTASKNGDTHRDFLLRKYTPSGTPIWTNTYSSTVNAGGDQLMGMYLAPNGNAYLAGTTRVNGPDPDHMLTIKVDSAGNQQWSRVYEWWPTYEAKPWAIAGESNPENVAITGTSRRDAFYVDIVTVLYNANGDTIWIKRQPSGSQAEGYAVHIGANHDVYMAGMEAGTFITARIQNPAASVTRDITAPGPADFNTPVIKTGMLLNFTAITGFSPMFVSLFYNSVANTDWCTGTAAPSYLSRYRWVAQASSLVFTQAVLSIDPAILNAVLPGGHGMVDLLKYSIYQRPLDGFGMFCKLQTTYANGLLSANISSLSEFFIGSETDSFDYTLSVDDLSALAAVSVYPNPADAAATLSLDLKTDASVSVSLLDITGRKVATVFEGSRKRGVCILSVSTLNLAPGMYLCRIVADNRAAIVKLNVSH